MADDTGNYGESLIERLRKFKDYMIADVIISDGPLVKEASLGIDGDGPLPVDFDDSGKFIINNVSTMFRVPPWFLTPDLHLVIDGQGPYRVISDRGTNFVGEAMNIDVTIEKDGVETVVYGVCNVKSVESGVNNIGVPSLTYRLEKLL